MTCLSILSSAATSLAAKSVEAGPPSLIPRSFNDDAAMAKRVTQ